MGIFVRSDIMIRQMKWLTIGIFLLAIVVTSPVMAQRSTTCSVSTAIFTLNWKNPTLTEIGEYLCSFLFYPDSDSEFPGLTNSAVSMQQDVNGDSEPDLIVSDYLYVGILLWSTENDRYSLAYEISKSFCCRNPYSKTSLEDWTNDGTPEVVFDFRELILRETLGYAQSFIAI
jgi:hypothetical protein